MEKTPARVTTLNYWLVSNIVLMNNISILYPLYILSKKQAACKDKPLS